MTDWYRIELPTHLTWLGDPPFWRRAVVRSIRETEADAFRGRNLLRVFDARHTQFGLAIDLVMVLVDVDRARVVFAAFPSFIGRTVGMGTPMPTDEQYRAMRAGEPVPRDAMRVVGDDPQAKDRAASAEAAVVRARRLESHSMQGPQGDAWRVVTTRFDASPRDLLEPDGHTLTVLGATQMRDFISGVVAASQPWLADSLGERVEVEVERVSPVSGPPLAESLAGTSPADRSSDASSRVEIVGSSQSGFLTNPTVSAFWNGRHVGELPSLGGRLSFDIDTAGELRLKAGFRSATRAVTAQGAVLHLNWDRTWGKLVISDAPYRGR